MNAPREGLFDQLKGLDSRFWIVNTMEMFERLAYYGVRAVIAIYMVLPVSEGGPEFTHIQKGVIFAWWAGLQSLLPMFTGGYADRYGHKRTIVVAIVLKVIGYGLMAVRMDYEGFFVGCMFLAIGTAIFKPGVQGTLAATLKESSASVGWGVFYQLVNIGGFLGPVLAGVLRLMDWSWVFWSCALIVSINFLWLPFYKDPTEDMEISEEFSDPWKVLVTSVKGLFKPRVFFFCIVFSGFWVMFNQVFDLLPNMIDDWMDSSDLVGALGTSFGNPVVPWVLAALLGVVFGGVSGVMVLLALRPDHRTIREVPLASFAVVGIAYTGSFFALLSWVAPNYAPAACILGVGMAFWTAGLRVEARPLAIGAAAIALVGACMSLQQVFSAAGPELVRLADAGQQVNPEWMINLNPGLIVFTMIFFAYLTSYVRPLTSIIIGMIVATVGSLVAGTATVGVICLVGIGVFSIGEMLSSPKKMEYLAQLSPKGQEGLFMGYANVPVAIGWIAGSLFAGKAYEEGGDKVNLAKRYLVEELGQAPDVVNTIDEADVVATLGAELGKAPLEVQHLLFETYHPETIWYSIAAIGVASIVGMVIYDRVLSYIDSRAA